MFYNEYIEEESLAHKIGTNKLFKKFTKSAFFKVTTKPVVNKASKTVDSDSFRWAYKKFIENNPEVHLKIMRLTKPNATIDDLPEMPKGKFVVHKNVTEKDLDMFYNHNHKDKDSYYTIINLSDTNPKGMSDDQYQNFATMITNLPGFRMKTIQFYEVKGKLINNKYNVIKGKSPLKDDVVYIVMNDGQFNQYYYNELKSHLSGVNFYDSVIDALPKESNNCKYSYHDTTLGDFDKFYKYNSDIKHKDPYMFMRAGVKENELSEEIYQQFANDIASVPGYTPCTIQIYSFTGKLFNEKYSLKSEYPNDAVIFIFKASGNAKFYAGLGSKFYAQNFKTVADAYMRSEQQMNYNNVNKSQILCNNITEPINNNSLLYEVYYQDYLDNIIANEEALARELKEYIPVSESAYKNIEAITEAQAGDAIKANCTKFTEFIKNLTDKFINSITNVILNENRKWLKDNEDIIKNKKPKSGQKITHTGDYDIAIKRCLNLTLPVFDYEKYGEDLIQGNIETVILKIMQGKTGFTYDKDKDMAESFKAYFIAAEKGKITTDFSSLNMTELYNFCYNFKQIKDITDKDKNYIKQSADAISKSITEELRKNGENTNKPAQTNTSTSTASSNTQSSNNNNNSSSSNNNDSNNSSNQSNDNNNSSSENKNESTVLRRYGYYFAEADGDDKKDDTSHTNMEITGATDNNGNSSTDNTASDAAKSGHTEAELTAMANKWQEICRKIIGARFNAFLQIAKNYMTILRAHVASYNGKSTNNNDNNKNEKNNNSNTEENNKK